MNLNDRIVPNRLMIVGCAIVASSMLLLAGCPRPAPLALKKVVLYQNGIGYFERQGRLSGDRLRLRLRTHELDDVLKSLTVIDRTAGDKPRPVTAVVPEQRRAAADPEGGKKQPAGDETVWLDISLGHRGTHDLLIAYSVPTPAWKATYRLVLADEGEGKSDESGALIQGWALVNNASGEDWADVALTLATGAPMTFAMDMRTPRFIARPDLSGQMVKPVTTGAVTSESARAKRDLDGVAGDEDGDGVADAKDLCPREPEDRDGFEDADGCPDPDNDKDRLVDADDKCPNEPETYNGYSDDDGCPDKGRVVVHRARIEIMDKIYFGRGSAAIKNVSMPIIEAIAASLKGNPQIRVIEVQGHASPAEADVWGLSARRAGAVRAALKRLGVSTEVRARAYGATRPIGTGKGEEQQARDRRAEFSIVKRADDEDRGGQPVSRGAVTARAAEKSVHRGARLATVAGMVRYRLPGEVSIRKGTTTMVTMINRRIAGRDVFLFRPDDNVPGSEQHPQRAAMLDNSSKLTLEPGPVAIFARGTFVGEGLISRLHPGQTAFIPYAIDSSASVRVSSSSDETPSTFVSLVDGVATVENHSQTVTRYEVQTGGEAPRQIVVKHPRRTGYELLELPPGTSTTPTAALVPFPIDTNGTSVLEIKERKPVRRKIWITSGAKEADRLALYIDSATALGSENQEKLRRLVAARRRVARLSESVDQLRGRISDIGVRSGELRESLKAVAKTRGGAALRRKLLARLSETVTAMESATQKLADVSLKLSAARTELKELVASLKIPAGQDKGKRPGR